MEESEDGFPEGFPAFISLLHENRFSKISYLVSERKLGIFSEIKGNISISPGIPIASPFCKGGLREIFLIQPGLFENLRSRKAKIITTPLLAGGKITVFGRVLSVKFCLLYKIDGAKRLLNFRHFKL